jgi:hypothetical protein
MMKATTLALRKNRLLLFLMEPGGVLEIAMNSMRITLITLEIILSNVEV